MESDLVLVLAVAAALLFAFANGFGDAPAVVTAMLSGRRMPPRLAVAVVAVLAFAGALLTLQVAATVAERIIEATLLTPTAVFAGVAGALAWHAFASARGLASSATHALLGGLLGSTLALAGSGAVRGGGLIEYVVVPALAAPLLAFVLALAAIALTYRLVGRLRPGPVNRGYRLGGIAAGGMLALAHGSNDAQKTMGVIALALVAAGSFDGAATDLPAWVVGASAAALGLGTWSGGRRLLRGRGAHVVKLDSAQSFCVQGSGAAVILTASGFGFPVSTTQVCSGALVGAGAGGRPAPGRWGLVPGMLAVWLVTVPAAGAAGAAFLGLSRLLGDGAAGPVLIVVVAALGITVALWRRRSEDVGKSGG